MLWLNKRHGDTFWSSGENSGMKEKKKQTDGIGSTRNKLAWRFVRFAEVPLQSLHFVIFCQHSATNCL